MTKVLLLGLAVFLVLALSACAAGPNELADSADPEGEVAGFWRGLWHGFIAPLTFIVSLFNENVGVYEVHNSGAGYDFGFLLGAAIVFGGGGGGASSRRGR